MSCPICEGELWVCEKHPDKPWREDDGGCQCGAGQPCECNPCDRDNPPAMPPGYTINYIEATKP